MKEIIVIEDCNNVKDICFGCDDTQCDYGKDERIQCFLKNEPDYTTLQIPETFEELKEMCKNNLKGIEFAGGNAKGKIIQLNNIWFAENGDIWGYTDDFTGICNIAKGRTPQQMWNMLKSLVEEE